MSAFILIDPQYLPPIQTFTKFLIYEKVLIDDQQIFQKQTYRNRAIISGANNLMSLVVPVLKGKTRLSIGEVEISYTENWQHQHWKSISSAYGSSPFFIHYEEFLEPFFRKKFRKLLDLDLALIGQIKSLLQIPGEIILSSQFEGNAEIVDFRGKIHPKEKHSGEDPRFSPIPYNQTFLERHGFIENLSILDLLFNEGPASREILLRSTT